MRFPESVRFNRIGMPVPRSLVGRLTFTYAGVAALFLGISLLLLYLTVDTVLQFQHNQDLINDIDEYRELYVQKGVGAVVSELQNETIGSEAESEFLILLADTGEIVKSTSLVDWQEVDVSAVYQLWVSAQLRETSVTAVTLESHDAPVRIAYGGLSASHFLIVGESAESNAELLELLALVSLAVFLLSLPLIALLVWYLTRRTSIGIRRVSAVANHFATGNLDSRVSAVGEVDEIQVLADTFDSMANRIQLLIRSTREMTDNIAHDIRSPLGRIRLLAESLINDSSMGAANSEIDKHEAAHATIAECDRLIAMINTSLDVSETEAGVSVESLMDIDFSELVSDVFDFFYAAAEEKTLQMIIHAEPGLRVFGNRSGLQRLLVNLLDNAIKYTPTGGEIALRMRCVSHQCVMCLRNTCEGFAPEHHERIFDRFYRIDSSRNGSGCGLGLSYARAVARAHDGDISVSSEAGAFVEFKLVLPLSASSKAINAKLEAGLAQSAKAGNAAVSSDDSKSSRDKATV